MYLIYFDDKKHILLFFMFASHTVKYTADIDAIVTASRNLIALDRIMLSLYFCVQYVDIMKIYQY